jgi:RimJ/RimL family protein N-acetyltransferase
METIMIINKQEFHINGINYTVRSAIDKDAKDLSELRLQIDGETENLDRERGEAFIDIPGFEQIIKTDTENPRNLFLVAVVQDWGFGIGKNLLKESVSWADSNGIKKMTLNVLETNDKAIKLYKKLGFEIEGLLKNDKILADGQYYNTIIMARFKE